TIDTEPYSGISQTFEYKEYYVSIGIWVFKSREWADHKYQTSLRFGGNGSGYQLTDLGDEAQGWNTGHVKLRKGNVFIDIGMTLKADLDNKSDNTQSQPLTEQEKRAKEELEYQQSQEVYHQLMKEPWVQSTTLPKRVPNYSPEHKLAQQFARYVLDFMEQYSKDQGGIQ
ncbi:MAG TPA: hypothetical protein PLB18_21765, partial [Acidobacteriota bacterium]|nr:hypothetical protein [Acidobacteriota bacterium]